MLIEKKSGSERSRLRLIITLCFAALAAIGALGTLAWATRRLIIAQFNSSFVPIAPLTILLLLLLGASWFLCGVRPKLPWLRILAVLVGVIVVTLTSLTIYHAVMPGSFSIEQLLFPNTATLQGYPLAKISPLTTAIFLLGGLSLIRFVSSSVTRTRTIVALSGIVILSCGVVTTIGYVYHAPLLYGSSIIPVAIPTRDRLHILGNGDLGGRRTRLLAYTESSGRFGSGQAISSFSSICSSDSSNYSSL